MSITRIHDKNVTFDPRAIAAELRNPTRFTVPRRAVLRGTAACVALPMLESLLTASEARAQAASPPIRLVTWFIACGVWGPSWFPTDTGVNYTLSPTLAALAPVKSKVLVFAGITNAPCVNSQGSHGCGPPGMTTCTQGTKPAIGMGISIDQVYAQSLGPATRIPSLQISGTDGTFSDTSYPAVYNGTTSWSSATQPLPPVVNPGLIFDQLFAGSAATTPTTTADPAAAAALAKRKALRKSVLDEVLGRATTLSGKLGKTDQVKLDQYLTSVRAAETAVQQSMSSTTTTCSPGTMTRPTMTVGPDTNGFGLKIYDPNVYTNTMTDLMALAFQCDATRVINYQQMNGGHSSYSSFPWLTPVVSRDHHSLSHHNGNVTSGLMLAQIEAWEIGLFSAFLQKLDKISEGSGTVLDNSLIFLSSE
ncbi:MAG TPA: DUF1552 domain-containing protein, partial [Polyangiaceae bacterium]|nr:DUF1552 domain-containing protein [Polyangiaceae bacterium]